jgi:hypothetical protein
VFNFFHPIYAQKETMSTRGVPEIKTEEVASCGMGKMNEGMIVFMVVVVIVLLMTLMMAWASHRKLKSHELYLAVLLEKYVEDEEAKAKAEAAAAAAATTTTGTTTTGSASSLRGSGASAGGSMKPSSAEMCNDLRSPMGGKIYNRDCLKNAMNGSSSKPLRSSAAFPNINTVIQKDYNKSG